MALLRRCGDAATQVGVQLTYRTEGAYDLEDAEEVEMDDVTEVIDERS